MTDSIDDETATPFAPVPEPPTLPQIGVAYFAQVLLNYLAPMAVGYALDTVFRMELIQERSASANVAAQIGQAVAVAFAGLVLGLVIRRFFPSTRMTALWVWIPALALLLSHGLSTYSRRGFHAMVNDHFFTFRPGADESPLGIFLITYPAWSSIWYSLATFFPGRESRKSVHSGLSAGE